jgi:DMSO reductase anchor subunit
MRLFSDFKRLFPILISAVIGVLTIVSTVRPNPLGDALLQIAQITIAVGLVFGLWSVIASHLAALGRRAPRWPQSLIVAVAALAVFVLELLQSTSSGQLGVIATDYTVAAFYFVYQPLATSFLALLTFFALRAAWRALQLRPVEAVPILLVTIVFLLAGGPWSAFVPGLTETLAWINSYPVLGVARGLLLGIGLGALVASVRLLLGFDHPYLDR